MNKHKPEDDGNSNKNDKKKKTDKSKKKPAWMSVKPVNTNLKKPRKWNGTMWHWCSPETGGKCNGVYRVHKPLQCKGKAASKKGKGKLGDSKGNLNDKVTIKEAEVEEITGRYKSLE